MKGRRGGVEVCARAEVVSQGSWDWWFSFVMGGGFGFRGLRAGPMQVEPRRGRRVKLSATLRWNSRHREIQLPGATPLNCALS